MSKGVCKLKASFKDTLQRRLLHLPLGLRNASIKCSSLWEGNEASVNPKFTDQLAKVQSQEDDLVNPHPVQTSFQCLGSLINSQVSCEEHSHYLSPIVFLELEFFYSDFTLIIQRESIIFYPLKQRPAFQLFYDMTYWDIGDTQELLVFLPVFQTEKINVYCSLC